MAAVLAAMTFSTEASAQYYKDLFMDGGINVTSRVDLPAARYLGISWERYYSASHKKPSKLSLKDTLEQAALFIGSETDENGILLYPDGAPRFRVIYVNGGRAGAHGRSLTEAGRNNFRKFVAGGGSYIGTCAGAFVSSQSDSKYDKSNEADFNQETAKCLPKFDDSVRVEYLGIYPARTISTGNLVKTATELTLPEDSPLLKYYDFGGDFQVDSVYHNGGCFITRHPQHFAPGTEVLMYYKYDQAKEQERIEKGRFAVTGKIAVWAYKPSEFSGRIVNCGSHPEGVINGERLQLFASFIQYAMAGNGCPVVKGELKNGQQREMVKKTSDNDPAFTAVGDRQYHHFTVEIPENAKDIVISLKGDIRYSDCPLNLTLKKGDFAFREVADYADVELKVCKTARFDTLAPGTWYIGVEGATTVETVQTDHGEEYTGNTKVLNGVPYTIKVSWK